MLEHRQTIIRQSGVIPYRVLGTTVKVAIVTAKAGDRWIVPKGHLEPDLTPWESAAKEAYEEAGLIGRVERHAVGSYEYEKRGERRIVDLYPMAVTNVLSAWPEDRVRRRLLLPLDEALDFVACQTTRGLIAEIGSRLDARTVAA